MICPFCRHDDSRVVDSRQVEDGTQIRRRRECPECGARFSTQETTLLNIIKRSGATEPFSRDKVIAGVGKACQGRPVNSDDLALLAQRVEEALRSSGQAEIEAQEVGMAIWRHFANSMRLHTCVMPRYTVTLTPSKISKARSPYCEQCHRVQQVLQVKQSKTIPQHEKIVLPRKKVQ